MKVRDLKDLIKLAEHHGTINDDLLIYVEVTDPDGVTWSTPLIDVKTHKVKFNINAERTDLHLIGQKVR